MKSIKLWAVLFLFYISAAFVPFAHGAIDVYQFENEAQEEQFKELGKLLRCPKCQNQNIADSNAELAKTLRQKTYEMTKAGKSQQEIVDYMVARFGHFVVYEPPVNVATVFLWLGPILLIAFGLLVLWRSSQGSSKQSCNASLSASEQERLAALLKQTDAVQKEEKQSL